MTDIAEIGFFADTSDIKTATKDLDKLVPATDRAERATDRLNDEFDRGKRMSDRYATGLRSVMGIVSRVAGVVAGAFSISQFVEITNTWTDLNSRVKIAAGSMEVGALVMERIIEIADRTYSSLTLTTESYLLNARALRELGFSTNQTLDFTEALNNALVVAGAKGDRAAMVQNAIAKAMAIGALRGEELNTVIQSGGRVAEALAAGLGVATTELRALGNDGKITSKVLFDALISQFDLLREEAEGMPATIGDAFLKLGNRITEFVGKTDAALGISRAIADAILFVSDNFATLAQILPIVGAGMVAAFGPGIATMIGSVLVGAVLALNKAIMANPIGFIATAIVMAITAIWQFRDAIKDAIGVDVTGIFKGVGNFIIQTFLIAFEQIKWLWSTLPNIMGSATVGAVNLVIDGLNTLIGASIQGINSLINAIPEQLRFGIVGIDPDFGKIERMTDGYKAAADAGNAAYAASVKTITSTDYIGDLAASFGTLSTATEATIGAMDELSGGSAGGAGGGSGGAIDRVNQKLEDFAKHADEVRQKAYELREAVAGHVVDAFKGFFSGLRQGMSVVDAFGDAIGRLADRLLDMVLDGALNSIIGGMFGLGTIAGGAAIPTGGFIPGITGPKLFAKGGIFGAPTLFDTGSGLGMAGEAGPEAILPLHRAANGGLGVAMAGNDNYVGRMPSLNVAIYNNASNDVEATATVGDDGSLIVQIDRVVAKNIADPSSQTNKAIGRSFGARNTTVSR